MKLKKSLKAKWVKALRSGKFDQGMGSLMRKHTDIWNDSKGKYVTEKEYCCLGVACAIGITRPKREDGHRSSCWVSGTFLPSETQKTLANMNDEGKSFKKIAAWINRNL